MHWSSSTWVNRLSSTWKNEMIPRFMDFPYLEPIVEVFRLEELKFNSYPQVPQLQQSSFFSFCTSRKITQAKTAKPHEFLFIESNFLSLLNMGTFVLSLLAFFSSVYLPFKTGWMEDQKLITLLANISVMAAVAKLAYRLSFNLKRTIKRNP